MPNNKISSANTNIQRYSGNDLIKAAKENNSQFLKLVLATGVDINFQDENGETALMHAIRNDSTQAFNILIKNDRLKLNTKDNNGENSLMHSVKSHNNKFFKKLAKLNGYEINEQNNSRETVLTLAAKEKNDFATDWLLQFSANPNIKDNNGTTPFLLFAKSFNKESNIKLLDYFLYSGANVHETDKENNTALKFLEKNMQTKAANLVLEYKKLQEMQLSNSASVENNELMHAPYNQDYSIDINSDDSEVLIPSVFAPKNHFGELIANPFHNTYTEIFSPSVEYFQDDENGNAEFPLTNHFLTPQTLVLQTSMGEQIIQINNNETANTATETTIYASSAFSTKFYTSQIDSFETNYLTSDAVETHELSVQTFQKRKFASDSDFFRQDEDSCSHIANKPYNYEEPIDNNNYLEQLNADENSPSANINSNSLVWIGPPDALGFALLHRTPSLADWRKLDDTSETSNFLPFPGESENTPQENVEFDIIIPTYNTTDNNETSYLEWNFLANESHNTTPLITPNPSYPSSSEDKLTQILQKNILSIFASANDTPTLESFPLTSNNSLDSSRLNPPTQVFDNDDSDNSEKIYKKESIFSQEKSMEKFIEHSSITATFNVPSPSSNENSSGFQSPPSDYFYNFEDEDCTMQNGIDTSFVQSIGASSQIP